MKTLTAKKETPKNETPTDNNAMETVIAELERTLKILETDYRKAVTNINALRACVETDELTKLLRRGAFMAKLGNLLESAKADGCEVHLMMIDIDHFKRVNDTHGHQTGDVVLERVSELIKNYLRPQDLAGRYGGEEIIVAVQADRNQAMQIAENIRNAVATSKMVRAANSSVEFTVTLSVGVASTRDFKYEADVLIAQADSALYRAKHEGRNQVRAADESRTIQAQSVAASNPGKAAPSGSKNLVRVAQFYFSMARAA